MLAQPLFTKKKKMLAQPFNDLRYMLRQLSWYAREGEFGFSKVVQLNIKIAGDGLLEDFKSILVTFFEYYEDLLLFTLDDKTFVLS